VSRRQRATEEVLVRGLFEEHGAALLAYATRLAGDRSPAEDVVRETLIRAARDPGALTGGRGAARAFLFTIVRGLTAGKEPADAPVDSMTMLTAVESLPPEQREVLHALYFQGRGVAETAASLGVPAGTVKSRSYHALRRLREAVG
jgi:RNA polymerase sigma-70 factor, ECF subfamily